MEQVTVLMPDADQADMDKRGRDELEQLGFAEYGFVQLRDQFMAILTVNYKDVSAVSNSSSNIITYIARVHEYVQKMMSHLRNLRSSLTYFATLTGPIAESPRKAATTFFRKLERVIVDALGPLFDHLPTIFELTIHDFSDIFSCTIDVIAQLQRVSNTTDQPHVQRCVDSLHRKLMVWSNSCVDGLFGTTTMVLTMHSLHLDWGSHSMFQRNKRCTPSVTAFLSTAKSMLYSLSECCKRLRSNENYEVVISYSLPLLLRVVNQAFQDIVRLYTGQIVPSRVRLWLFKADLVFTLLNLMTMLHCVRTYVGFMLKDRPLHEAKVLDADSHEACRQMHMSLKYILWYLYIVYDNQPDELMAYVRTAVDGLDDIMEASATDFGNPNGDLAHFLDEMESLLSCHTNLERQYHDFFGPIRSNDTAIPSASSGDIYYNYSADVTCMLGLLPDANVDHLKSKEGNGYMTLMGQLIDIVNAFASSNPLVGVEKATVVDLLVHASNMAEAVYVVPGSESDVPLTTITRLEVRRAIKKVLLKRYDVQDCEYPALTEPQMLIYKRFLALIRECLLKSKAVPDDNEEQEES